jgi:spermidine/putrescine transport system ATP-binding protein
MNRKEYDVILESVSKEFDNITAVANVSLKVKKGTFLTLLGPSGCGKTTTLRIIGGLESPTDGRIFLRGRDVTDVPPYKRDTNLVFQDFALFPHMNVFSNIAFGLKMRGSTKQQIKKRVLEMLDLVGLPDISYRKPNQLSGGQRQRVALCRSLIMEPAVLLLDEPLGALDAMIRKQMQTELKNLQVKLDRTFISVTHDQEEAMSMSDNIAIMNQGYIEQVGSPHNIYEKPATKFVATFLGECNLIDVVVVGGDQNRVAVQSPQLPGSFYFNPSEGWQNKSNHKHMSMMIRPENITIVRGKEAYENQIDGVIKELIFKGSITEYVVQANTNEIKLQIQGKSQFSQGENVTVTWQETDCYLIP